MPPVATRSRRDLLGLSRPASTPGTAAPAKGGSGDAIFGSGFESPPPVGPSLAVRVLNKAAYGPRPGDVAAFNALGATDQARLAAWVDQQLAPGSISDTDCDNRIAAGGYTTYTKSLAQLWSDHVRDRGGAGLNNWPRRYYPVDEAQCIKLLRAVYSRRQLFEVMVDFWHNHFNVQGWDFGIAPVFMHYDRDVIRPRAFGNFRQMLEAVAKAPAMLMYLDNKSSTLAGYNENYARELCELHTLGAQNYYGVMDPGEIPRYPDGLPRGYSDFYVYEAARCFTGWTMSDDHWQFPNTPEYDTGEFRYHGPWHDIAGKNFLARDFGDLIPPNQPAMLDGYSVLDRLASHPGTAEHLCGKICRRLIGDEPPVELVASAAAIWQQHWQSSDQIVRVLRHILNSEAFAQTWGEKVKRPYEAVIHAMRATSIEFQPEPRPTSGWNVYTDLSDRISNTGNGPFRWPTPDGYPDVAAKWQSVSALSQSWHLMSRLPEMRGSDVASNTSFLARIHQQTLAGLAEGQRTAAGLVDFWIARIFGYEINRDRRQQLIDFLRQNGAVDEVIDIVMTDSGQSGQWNSGNLKRHHSIARLRATVALMFTLPEFYQR